MDDLDEVIRVFSEISDPVKMKAVFEELFTDAERKDLASRWGLMKDLKTGMSQRKIAKKRKISLCKITRGSKILKNPASVSSRLIDDYVV
ncbi:MAG: transcriptional regulator [Deltaproteobacteria bacterium]|jgi:TrpR family transcriptional regulator, trp operon repressor|nr:transcriptional regulator [Deltaproteobacteria bacterium]MBT4637824.1 transcriptional regulator [Deltaproteobacteria bacterium]MBT6499338.1 transcriptional regulator [Deltaproteobacteria bacterium]MBT6613793.1 transcriptional regulator [Deltaproteobacteria bacterium]MBT7150823.1 transcriptional regulator [Deltaproteobacteria bacterium]